MSTIRKAFTLSSPWHYAILEMGKRVENRSVKFRYRGPVLLHVAQGDSKEYPYEVSVRAIERLSGLTMPERGVTDCHRGLVVATARIVGLIGKDGVLIDGAGSGPSAIPVAAWKWHIQGQYGYVLDDVKPVAKPYPMRGSRGLYAVQ